MIQPSIHYIYFNTYGYSITLLNHPNNIVRLYRTFTPFDKIPEKKDRYNVFILSENIRFLLNYRHSNTEKTITVNDILLHCEFLSHNDREFIKLQMV